MQGLDSVAVAEDAPPKEEAKASTGQAPIRLALCKQPHHTRPQPTITAVSRPSEQARPGGLPAHSMCARAMCSRAGLSRAMGASFGNRQGRATATTHFSGPCARRARRSRQRDACMRARVRVPARSGRCARASGSATRPPSPERLTSARPPGHSSRWSLSSSYAQGSSRPPIKGRAHCGLCSRLVAANAALCPTANARAWMRTA